MKNKDEALEKCEWCNGSGDDGGGYNACPDCESTGLKGGKHAEKLLDKMIEEQYQEHLKSQKKEIEQ